METWLGGLSLAIIGGWGAIWWRLGRLEAQVKRSCPFGQCPFFKRAADEAAPLRDNPG